MSWLFVAIGGALGSMTRYGFSRLWPMTPGGFPVPTLTVNLIGSFAIGLLYMWFSARAGLGNDGARLFWLTGVLGGYTTYSAFALESTLLGLSLTGVAYVLVTTVGCIGLAWLGRLVGAALIAHA
ncbi:MAG TPA: CrcB family protein [Steroidobacteraceae bacterium]|nr:CrcB family protein [Steroidobacteraceae bacterium]